MPLTQQQKDAVKGVLDTYGLTNYGAGSGFSTPWANPNTPQVTFKEPGPSGFFGKVGAVTSQTFNMGKALATRTGRFAVNTVEDVAVTGYRTAKILPELGYAAVKNRQAGDQIKELNLKMSQASAAYRAGKLSKEDFQAKLKEINQGLDAANKTSMDSLTASQDARSHVWDVPETAVNILSLGMYAPLKSGIKVAGTGFVIKAGNEGVTKALEGVLQNVENAVARIPAVRDLIRRNTSKLVDRQTKILVGETTAQFMTRNSKQIAFGLLIKRPILYETNIGLGEDAYNKILEHNRGGAVGDAAWIAVQGIGGGPIGWLARNAKSFGIKIKELSIGRGSFIDAINRRTGADIVGAIRSGDKDIKKFWSQMEAVNVHMTDGDVERAADNFLRNYLKTGRQATDLTEEYLRKASGNWARADELAQQLSKELYPAEAVRYVAVRWDTPTKKAFAEEGAKAMDEGGNYTAKIVELLDESDFGNNHLLRERVLQILKDSPDGATFRAAINDISTASIATKNVPKAIEKEASKLGFTFAEPFGGRKTPIIAYDDTRKIVSELSSGKGDELFDPAIAPHPVLNSLTLGLRKFGLSPESNTKVAFEKLSQSLVINIQESGVVGSAERLGLVGPDTTKGAQYIFYRLKNYVDKQKPNRFLNIGTLGKNVQSALQDIRQMAIHEIQEALPGLTSTDARTLMKAINKAHTDVSMEFRGLGIKAFDYAYRIPGAKTYFRIQSALRYTYNPFFRFGQEVPETKTLAHMEANNLVWMKSKAELNRGAKLLDDAELFTTGYTGEATQDLTIGRIHANLFPVQKRDLAGLGFKLAERQGKTLEQLIEDNPEQLADALRVIVQYPTKGALNSPLARTLNIAFFPMRYNIKVAGLVAKQVAKLPPTYQTAFIHSMLSLRDWMKSDEGIAWQSDNIDAIQIFNYFSVLNNIQSVFNRLHWNRPESIGAVGMLGGLPFGFISQFLDNEGLINLNTPYVNPKTGEVMPDYIPETTKAQAAVALQTLLNTMFTYPGRIIGLPGKEAQIRRLTGTFIDVNGADFRKNFRLEDLTPLQRKWVEVLSKRDVTQDEIDQLYVSPAPGEFQWYTLPPINLPAPVTPLTKVQVAEMKAAAKKARGGSRGKKKALPLQIIK